jgi:hypothetical protein
MLEHKTKFNVLIIQVHDMITSHAAAHICGAFLFLESYACWSGRVGRVYRVFACTLVRKRVLRPSLLTTSQPPSC